MKYFAALILSLAMCGAASAAPLTNEVPSDTNKAMAAEMLGSSVETGAMNRNGLGSYSALSRQTGDETGGGGSSVPEPASLMLLGIGLGAAALFKRK